MQKEMKYVNSGDGFSVSNPVLTPEHKGSGMSSGAPMGKKKEKKPAQMQMNGTKTDMGDRNISTSQVKDNSNFS